MINIVHLSQVRSELLYYHNIIRTLGTKNVVRGPVLKLQCIYDFSDTNFNRTKEYKEHVVERGYKPAMKLVNSLKKSAKHLEILTNNRS